MQSNATPTLKDLEALKEKMVRDLMQVKVAGKRKAGGDGTERGAAIDLTESDEEEQEQEQEEEEQQAEGAFCGYSGEEDSYDEFEAYRSDPGDAEDAEEEEAEEEQADAEEAPRGTRPVVTMRSMTLPVVTSYALDLPKGKRAWAQFDREVDAIYRRISGGWRK
jgi:hypothetical protein